MHLTLIILTISNCYHFVCNYWKWPMIKYSKFFVELLHFWNVGYLLRIQGDCYSQEISLFDHNKWYCLYHHAPHAITKKVEKREAHQEQSYAIFDFIFSIQYLCKHFYWRWISLEMLSAARFSSMSLKMRNELHH